MNFASHRNTYVLFCLAGAKIHLISTYPKLFFILFYAFVLCPEIQRVITVFFFFLKLIIQCFVCICAFLSRPYY